MSQAQYTVNSYTNTTERTTLKSATGVYIVQSPYKMFNPFQNTVNGQPTLLPWVQDVGSFIKVEYGSVFTFIKDTPNLALMGNWGVSFMSNLESVNPVIMIQDL